MEPSSSSELAALVAAWHNRHPLARRISAAQVQGAGLVALPFVAPRGSGAAEAQGPSDGPGAAAPPPSGWRRRLQAWLASLRQRLPRPSARQSAAPRPGALRAAFDEDFISPLRPAQVARFARRHGTVTRPNSPLDWPQRDVARRPGRPGTVPRTLYLRTAAIEVGKQRRRVLIGAGPRPAVSGPRLWSRPRVAALLGLAGCAVALAAWFGAGGLGPNPDDGARSLTALTGGRSAASGAVQDAPASAPVSAASAPASAPPSALAASARPGVAPAVPTAADAVPSHSTPAGPPVALAPAASPAPSSSASAVSHPASASATGAAMAPQQPPPAESGEEVRRSIRPTLSPEARLAARQESEALRAAHPASAAAAASASDGKVYAVATPTTRTRAGAQLRIVLMNAPTEADPGRPRAEVMQVGTGWRAVIWPFDNRDAAERTRQQLASRGIPAEVIGF